MSDRFQELIRNSAADMPDPGEYRRLNRVPLRAPVKRYPGIPRPRHSFVMVTACLAIMVLFSGQISQLGSDDFDMVLTATETYRGQKKNTYKDTFSGSTWVSGRSEEEIRELDQAYVAREGELSWISNLSVMGTNCWSLYRIITKEDGSTEEIPAQKPPELGCEAFPNITKFYETYFRDLKMRADYLTPDEVSTLQVFDVTFEIRTWRHPYPEFGEVSYSRGFPVETP